MEGIRHERARWGEGRGGVPVSIETKDCEASDVGGRDILFSVVFGDCGVVDDDDCG